MCTAFLLSCTADGVDIGRGSWLIEVCFVEEFAQLNVLTLVNILHRALVIHANKLSILAINLCRLLFTYLLFTYS